MVAARSPASPKRARPRSRARPAPAPAAPTAAEVLRAAEAVQKAYERLAEPPLRLIEDFACTGGRQVSGYVAALPNTVVAGGVDPLGALPPGATSPDYPTDVLAELRRGPRAIGGDLLADAFLAAVLRLRKGLVSEGRHLVLRGHALSRFRMRTQPVSGPGLCDILRRSGLEVRGVLVLRHPLDSYLELSAVLDTSSDLEDYARAYLRFLDANADLARIRHEDFAADPGTGLSRLADLLSLPFDVGALTRAHLFVPAEGGGAEGAAITARPRRPVPPEVRAAARTGASYAALCARLAYDPDPGGVRGRGRGR